jgi:hypothetical protein
VTQRPATIAAAVLLAGCTLAPGTGFSALSAATLAVSFTPGPGRLDASGGMKTDLGYRLTFTKLSLTTDDLVIQSRSTTAGGQASTTTFDPAKPPAGYSLCHGGHCHRADGALVDYADIAASLSGGGTTTLQDVLTLPFRSPLRLMVTPQTKVMPLPATGQALDQAAWHRAELRFGKLEASGTVVDATPDGRLGSSGNRSWRLSWTPPALGKAVNVIISRKSPPSFSLLADLQVSDQLFDQIDWEALSTGNPVISLQDQPDVTRQLTENFAKSALILRIQNP